MKGLGFGVDLVVPSVMLGLFVHFVIVTNPVGEVLRFTA